MYFSAFQEGSHVTQETYTWMAEYLLMKFLITQTDVHLNERRELMRSIKVIKTREKMQVDFSEVVSFNIAIFTFKSNNLALICVQIRPPSVANFSKNVKLHSCSQILTLVFAEYMQSLTIPVLHEFTRAFPLFQWFFKCT